MLHCRRLAPMHVLTIAGSPAEPHAAHAGPSHATDAANARKSPATAAIPTNFTALPAACSGDGLAAHLEKGRRGVGGQQLGFAWPSESSLREGDAGWRGCRGCCPSTACPFMTVYPHGMILYEAMRTSALLKVGLIP